VAHAKRAKTNGGRPQSGRGIRTLAIDIGGTGLKASVLDEEGQMLVDRVRVETPVGSPPEGIVETLAKLVEPLPAFDRVSVGFPGVVRDGWILTAPNLGHTDWEGHRRGGTSPKGRHRPPKAEGHPIKAVRSATGPSRPGEPVKRRGGAGEGPDGRRRLTGPCATRTLRVDIPRT